LQAHPKGTKARAYPGAPPPVIFTRDFEPGYDGGKHLFREHEVYGDTSIGGDGPPKMAAFADSMGPVEEPRPPVDTMGPPRTRPPPRTKASLEERKKVYYEEGVSKKQEILKEKRMREPEPPPVPQLHERPQHRTKNTKPSKASFEERKNGFQEEAKLKKQSTLDEKRRRE